MSNKKNPMNLGGFKAADLDEFRAAVLDRTPVSLGPRRTQSPHEFYRYPARFSPRFARAAIECFSVASDVVLDPFVGGGTTAVEAQLLGRRAVVSDLNPIATFVSRVKATPLEANQLAVVTTWLGTLLQRLKVNLPEPPLDEWASKGYLKDIDRPDTWRIRKLVAQALDGLPTDPVAEDFCRCIVLRTAQWALDMRSTIPTTGEFRQALQDHGAAMIDVARAYALLFKGKPRATIIEAGLPGLSEVLVGSDTGTPSLVVTSPPYPGVYVNYHRWKMLGRREIPAPYWIASRYDGHGLAHYTMSARAEPTLDVYFARITAAFTDLAGLLGPDTWVVQLVGFNNPATQLDRYLKAMREAGLREVAIKSLATAPDGRLWRTVPGRRWWTEAQANRGVAPHTAQEVVLFHRLCE